MTQALPPQSGKSAPFTSELRPEDIEVFSEAIAEYFRVSAGEEAAVRSAWLMEAQAEPVIWNDCNGLITVAGEFIGSICFSAPQKLLEHVLLITGESYFNLEKCMDLVGEIANTLSGRARRHFGEGLDISPPRALRRQGGQILRLAHSTPFAIPMTWRNYEANLVVNLDRAR